MRERLWQLSIERMHTMTFPIHITTVCLDHASTNGIQAAIISRNRSKSKSKPKNRRDNQHSLHQFYSAVYFYSHSHWMVCSSEESICPPNMNNVWSYYITRTSYSHVASRKRRGRSLPREPEIDKYIYQIQDMNTCMRANVSEIEWNSPDFVTPTK